ncbi:MAG TPA: deoxyribose-phosphate aldolase [bacterium]|jgi:deoxyribose-phosphate aldolase|nr:deoxyribose-phosphate aldolase [bacterium]HPG44601.1 deoxyribose-phosphate aldolase [bacterium]HPM97159.1 deoxyribose-phosphate aldolase [bacterium]
MSLEKQIAAALNACVPLSPDHQLVLPHLTGAELAAMIDHTLLHAAARRDDLIKLCGEAKTYGFAAVCVNPVWVGECQNLLQDSQIPVCSVIGFPLGATGADLKAREASWVVDCGAREVDMVVHVGALLNREYAVVAKEIELVVKAAHPWPVKVILETGLLKTEEIVAGCIIARNSGARFVKTSTGFGPAGATVEAVHAMRQTVGSCLGVKASGGIRDRQAALQMIAAGASRIGTSSGVKISSEEDA